MSLFEELMNEDYLRDTFESDVEEDDMEKAANPTIDEAIQYFKGIMFPSDCSPSTLKAVAVNRMAINALELQWDNQGEYLKEDIENALEVFDHLSQNILYHNQHGIVYSPEFCKAIETASKVINKSLGK